MRFIILGVILWFVNVPPAIAATNSECESESNSCNARCPAGSQAGIDCIVRCSGQAQQCFDRVERANQRSSPNKTPPATGTSTQGILGLNRNKCLEWQPVCNRTCQGSTNQQ